MKRAGAEAAYRRALAHRLREKSAELEDAIFDRIRALEQNSELKRRPGGLRPLIRSLVEYGAVAIEAGERQCPPPPATVLDHARKAAWAAVTPLDLHTGYLAARSAFEHFLRSEALSVKGYMEATLVHVQVSNDIVFERLFRIVGEEYEREIQKRKRSTATQQLERVRALLAGALLEAPELGYDFEATHLGIVGIGEGVTEHVKQATRSLGESLLLTQPGPQKCWAWIGTKHGITSSQLKESLSVDFLASMRISLGEPACGLVGWRRTHREAEAGLLVANQQDQVIVRYSEVIMLAEMLRNDLLRTALASKYLAPLAVERDGGEIAKNTLRAYFSQSRQISSAAKLLGVKRHTVRNRLDDVEDRLGQPIDSCAAELEIALRMEELDPSSSGQPRGRGG